MQISLNISEDMVMTFKRCEKSIKGENPGPFFSSFTRNSSIEYNDFKDKNPLDKLDNLGFGDTILSQYMDDKENNNNNSLNNSLNDLFEKDNKSTKLDISQNSNKIDENDLFTNMSNSLNDSMENLNINKERMANNNELKRLLKINDDEKKDIRKSQKLPSIHMSINDDGFDKNDIISKKYLKSGKNLRNDLII